MKKVIYLRCSIVVGKCITAIITCIDICNLQILDIDVAGLVSIRVPRRISDRDTAIPVYGRIVIRELRGLSGLISINHRKRPGRGIGNSDDRNPRCGSTSIRDLEQFMVTSGLIVDVDRIPGPELRPVQIRDRRVLISRPNIVDLRASGPWTGRIDADSSTEQGPHDIASRSGVA